MPNDPPVPQTTPGDLNFAAHVLLGEAQRYRLVADRQERKGSNVVAGETRRDAERLTAVAMRLTREAKGHG